MRIAVRYQSRGGNTQKLAEAIAHKSGVVAKPLDPAERFEQRADLLFIGGGIYAGKPGKTVTESLAALTQEHAGAVAFFYTAHSPDEAMAKRFKDLVKDTAITVVEEAYGCPGKFLFFKKGHPNAVDLDKAESFAKRVIDSRRKALDAL